VKAVRVVDSRELTGGSVDNPRVIPVLPFSDSGDTTPFHNNNDCSLVDSQVSVRPSASCPYKNGSGLSRMMLTTSSKKHNFMFVHPSRSRWPPLVEALAAGTGLSLPVSSLTRQTATVVCEPFTSPPRTLH
jgi:hypothetical protein